MEGGIHYPKMRSVDVFPAEVSGQRVICLRDPLHLSEKILFIPYPTFFIISLFDGQHSLADIQAEFMRCFGELVYRERVQELVDLLEEHYLLDSERFRQAERRIVENFQKIPQRPMALVGESYEGDPEKLRQALESFFASPEGPGFPADQKEKRKLVGAIAPHIDYRRGGHCYAFAHRAIQEAIPADLYVILGTAHAATHQPFILTRKSFQTPWGPVETDQDFVAALEEGYSFNLYEDEFVHKSEHSIELQLVFLRAFWRQSAPFRIVPILCGSFQDAILREVSPLELPGVGAFLEAFRQAAAQAPKRVCLLASADLAHVGLRFGDPEPPNRWSLESLAGEDEKMLGYVERADAEGFFRGIAREKDRRRICGLAPIYILLQILGRVEGKLLKYSQSLDGATQSVVTFASLVYYS